MKQEKSLTVFLNQDLMNKILFFVMMVVFFASCKSEEIDRSDALSAGRGFVEASLKGDYVKAERYMLKDSTNEQYLDGLREFSAKLTPLEREHYRDADIIIDSTRSLSDSVDIIYYKNSYKKEPTPLKLVKKDDQWWVDFKYTFVNNP